MPVLQANCPACGAPIAFKSGSSIVVVCEYCNSVVARTDRALEDLGKVADVVESGSPLDVGLKGVYRGVAFELTGRAQLAHAAGGIWDEWYAAFADGRWGWLAEAQGRFYLTYKISSPIEVPPFDALSAGERVPSIPVSVPMMVAEKGEARMLAAEGEIPYRLVPGETYAYADLSGAGGTFATIDYGETPAQLFVGREVPFAELGIAESARKPEREAPRVSAAQLQCPQCAGPLELRAPDRAERVTCPNCGSLLDINHGQLHFLKALNPAAYTPLLALGSSAELRGKSFTIIGYMVRSVEFDATRYFWEEYLLYNPAIGFRWLVQSDNHWSFVETVPPGEAVESGKTVKFGGRTFKAFQDAAARVEHVAGEFYWKVTTGETVRAVDFIRPPEMLSKEVSGGYGGEGRRKKKEQPQQQPAPALEAEEVNWSLGTYIKKKEIERAFNRPGLPTPTTIAPNQPFPNSGIYKYWVAFLFVTFLAGFATLAMDSRRKAFEQTYRLQSFAPSSRPSAGSGFGSTFLTPSPRTPGAVSPSPQATTTPLPVDSGDDDTMVIFTEPIELKGRQNVLLSGRSNVDNNWLYVAGDLINEDTGLVQQFDLPMEYYAGVEDGESWTEGDKEKDVYLSALPDGKYTMRLEAQWDKSKPPAGGWFTVRVEQGVARGINFFLALLALSILPIIVLIKHFVFESRRWQDSTFNPFQSSGSSDN